MCGIIGYIGNKEIAPVLINGLKRLEYRGYDSSGLVVIDKQHAAHLQRAIGNVSSLEAKVGDTLSGSEGLGIAHTRWATHGQPSEANAHPHQDCTEHFWVVHNGIIENYTELKERLTAAGHIFKSQTDTEVLAHLIEEHYVKLAKKTLFLAVKNALREILGTYGMAVVSTYEPDKIIGARNSSPLIIGIGDGEYFITSDASAIVGYTKNVVYLEDGDIAELTGTSYRIESIGGEQRNRAAETIEWDAQTIERGGHDHFMHKELFEIPEVITNSIRGRLIPEEGLAKLGGIEHAKDKLRDIERILITGCGTASYAGRVGEYMLEEYAGIPTEVDIASEFRYRKPVLDKKTLLIAISQSGETADTLAAVKEAKEKGVMTLGIVNTVGSSIARETGLGVYNHAGPEISVASTKAFVSQLVVLSLLTVFLGRQREMSLVTGRRIAEELQRLPELVRHILATEGTIIRIAEKYADTNNFFCLGRKYNFPIALEAALKLKEICYIPSEGIPAGEIKHGSLALVDKDMPTLIIAPKDSVYEKTLSAIEQIRARGGPVIAITTEGATEVEAHAQDVIYIPKTLEMLTPILSVIPAYLFAYHVARLRGHSIDMPKNLAKSVTVE
jgi:glucosamine--fructose-6-phosphate aminotransferase (isomerizing)